MGAVLWLARGKTLHGACKKVVLRHAPNESEYRKPLVDLGTTISGFCYTENGWTEPVPVTFSMHPACAEVRVLMPKTDMHRHIYPFTPHFGAARLALTLFLPPYPPSGL